MWWSLLLSLALQLLKWLLSDDGPLRPKDAEKVAEFIRLARQAESRAYARGVFVPREE